MTTYAPEYTGSARSFDSHPEGTFSAVLCDVYALEELNYFCGKAGQDGKIDDRFTSMNLYLCFLTEAKIEINGEMKPRWIRKKFSFSLGKNANLAKTLKSWIKELSAIENLNSHFSEAAKRPIDSLIGTPAFIEVSHSENKRDPSNPYANITKISALPKFNPESGAPVDAMTIPADYKRSDAVRLQDNANRRIREKNPSWAPAAEATRAYKESSKPAADYSVSDDDLPF